MGKVIATSKKLTLEEVKSVLGFDQPKLTAKRHGSNIVIRGGYLLFEDGTIANPAGPISEFDVEIVVASGFPYHEPKVFEIGGRFPRHADRHINHDGDCCITVWEHWIACAPDRSFAAFIDGPVREYFLAQYWYEKTGTWPFGERAHGREGLQEAYAEALGTANKVEDIIYRLRLLSKAWPKGHWLCPCGGGKLLRHCHQDELIGQHKRIPPRVARRMLSRLKLQG